MNILDTKDDMNVRKHCQPLLKKLGVKSLNDIEAHKYEWSDLREALANSATAARSVLDRAMGAAESRNEEKSKSFESAHDGVMTFYDRLNGEMNRRNELGSKGPRPHGGSNNRPEYVAASSDAGEGSEHRAAFTSWLRKPQDETAKQDLLTVQSRSANSLTGAQGGYVVPEIIAGGIAARARDVNPLRGVVRVLQVDSHVVSLPLSNADATSGWVGETDTRTPTSEPTLDAKVPTFGTNYSYVKMTEELARAAIVDIAEWFQTEAGMALGESEMQAIISGDGVNKPKGMLNVAPEAGDDGARTANAYKFLPAASATAFTVDEMLDLVYDLKARYRANGRWLMNSSTAGALRKLKTGDGAYLWQDSVMLGQPNLFSGYPVTICEAMEDATANGHPIAFGDFQAGYILTEIQGMTATTQDMSITEPGYNKVYIRQRIGGCVYDENAVRFLKMAAT